MQKFRILGVIATAVLNLAMTARSNATSNFVIVVNNANSAKAISQNELKRAFTGGMKQWDSGQVVHVGLIPSDEAPETQYLASRMQVTAHALLSRIQIEVFKGEMKRPAMLKASADCVAFASQDPGSICVCPAGMPMNGTHVVEVQ